MISVTERTLPNGLRLLLVQRPGLHSLVLSSYFAGGAVDEAPCENGLTHVLEHMLFKGTERFRTPKAIQQAVEAIGGSSNARTYREGMEMFISCHPSTLRQGLRILTDAVYHPLFRPADLERERRVVIEELRSRKDDHATAFGEFEMATLFPHLPEGRPVGGVEEAVRRITIADVRHRYARVCQTDQQLLVAAGAFDPEEVVREVTRLTGRLRFQHIAPRRHHALPEAPVFGALERPTVQQATIDWTFRTFTDADPRWPRMWVLTHILGTRLFHRARERHALVYGIGAGHWSLRNQGLVNVGCRLDPVNIPALVRDVAAELRAVTTTPVRDVELENAIRLSQYSLDYDEDQPSALADWFAWQRLDDATRPLRTPSASHAVVAATTAGSLLALAREVFRPTAACCVTMAARPVDARSVTHLLTQEVRRLAAEG